MLILQCIFIQMKHHSKRVTKQFSKIFVSFCILKHSNVHAIRTPKYLICNSEFFKNPNGVLEFCVFSNA
eukprot:UN22915